MLLARYVLLAAGLAAASWTDCRQRKIPNQLTVAMALAGLLLSVPISGFSGLVQNVVGFLAGLVFGMLLWLLHLFRAGDAKLLAALGAVMGWFWLANCFFWALLLGAVVGCVLLCVKGQFAGRMKRLWQYLKLLVLSRSFSPYQPADSTGELPFAPCLALGALLACLTPLF